MRHEDLRALIRNTLDECPALIPKDRRYADEEGQRIAKDMAAALLARRLAAAMDDRGHLDAPRSIQR